MFRFGKHGMRAWSVRLAGLALCLSGAIAVRGDAADTKGPPPLNLPDSLKTGGFVIGCQAWTFNNFTVFEAIQKTAECGGKTIEFYSKQKLNKDSKEIFGHNSPDAVLDQVKEQLKKYNVRAVAYGVVEGKNPDEWRKIFEFGKKMGLVSITSEPNAKDMDLLEKLVKEFDIRLAIHDHPKKADKPDYKFWDPNYVLSLVKGRDARMGSCADTGHWARSGIKPVDALKILEGRVMSSHLKDLNEFGNATKGEAHDVPYGTGVSDVKGILDELKRQHFDGIISIEYEVKMDDKMPDVKKCFEFMKKYGESK
jgi:sugar phosphate isomerase/epimerase